MKNIFILLILILLSSIGKAQDNSFTSKWSNGYKITSTDKDFKMKFGGRVQWDNAFFRYDDVLDIDYGDIKNGSEFRRVRFFNQGSIYGNVKYKMQLDFAGGNLSFKDVYISLGDIPFIGNIKVGHFKEPFRLEALMSSKYITFMERAFPTNMSPERNTGMMIYNSFLDKKLSVQIGVFRNADKAGNDKKANDGYAITSRVTGVVLKNNEKHQLIHIGAGISYRKPETNTYKISLRPEAHLSHKFITTGSLKEIDNITLYNIETGLVFNTLSIQGEYVLSSVTNKSTTESLYSYYAMVSYFLTGEHRPYKSSYDGFARVKPKNNFGAESGIGAWELALRYSGANLNGDLIQGGKLNDITVGLNWYLNPVTRVMVNYVLADIVDYGKANIFQTRVQIDF